MSYLQRSSDGSSPFAQVYNTADWNISTRPNTTSQTWLSASSHNSNSYEFTGKGDIFGFMTASCSSLGRYYIAENSDFYLSGSYHWEINGSRAISDDEMIGYGDIVGHDRGAYVNGAYGSYKATSRLNVIRMEL